MFRSPPSMTSERKADLPRKRQSSQTIQARRAVLSELQKLRRKGASFFSAARYPALDALLATAEHAAGQDRRVAHHLGTRYRVTSTSLGRVIVCDMDGAPLVATGPMVLTAGDTSDSDTASARNDGSSGAAAGGARGTLPGLALDDR